MPCISPNHELCTLSSPLQTMKNVTWFNVPDNDDDMSSATRCQTMWSKLSPRARHVAAKFVWVVSTARNAIVVITCALIAYGCDPILPEEQSRNTTFILTGNIEAGLPDFKPPPFSVDKNDTIHETSDIMGHSAAGFVTHDNHAITASPNTTLVNNATARMVEELTGHVGFLGMVSELGSAIIIIPLIIILENVAIAKAFGRYKIYGAVYLTLLRFIKCLLFIRI